MTETDRPDPYRGTHYAYYALGLLTASYTLNFLDRQILAILQEPIKKELHLSDSQLGLLTGLSFAMFYILLGLPIARWADRGNRRNIASLALGLWSLMTALCGLAQTNIQLFLARIGVGVGEAGGSPPAYSMISDMFPEKARATALGIYGVGVNLGILAGFLTGGWLNEMVGWRAAFLIAGAPGLLLALLIRFTVKEPLRRPALREAGQVHTAAPPIGAVIKRLWAYRTFRHMVFGASLMSFAAYGAFNWLPSLLIRVHHLNGGVAGTWLALILGLGGAAGTFIGGWASDRLGRRDARWYCLVTVVAFVIAIPLMIAAFLMRDAVGTLICFAFPAAILAISVPPLMAVTHGLVENRMRALASAIVLFILNLLGLGLGPLAVGMLSDHLTPQFGPDGLRLAMLILLPAAATWGTVHVALAARHVKAELRTAA
jgi:MFS family permease